MKTLNTPWTSRLTRSFLAIALGSMVTLASQTANAQRFGSGFITDITIEGSQYARIAVSSVNGSTGCQSTNFTAHFAMDLNTVKGRAILSLAQSAQLAGKQIGVVGNDNCSTLAGGVVVENIRALTVNTN